MTVGHQTVHYF